MDIPLLVRIWAITYLHPQIKSTQTKRGAVVNFDVYCSVITEIVLTGLPVVLTPSLATESSVFSFCI